LFGILWALKQDGLHLPGDLWLVANVGEEGLGDLIGMRAVVDRFGDQPLAYIVLEGMTYGHVYHRGLGVRRYRITTHTAGGHSWGAFGNPSAIHELAALLTRLVALPLPKEPRTTINVGSISGGISVNSIAPEAHIDLDLRSEGLSQLEHLDAGVHELVREANRPGVQVTIEQVGERPVGEIPSTHPLVSLAVKSLKACGEEPSLNIGSTDANIPLSRGLPAICIGLTNGEGAHTTREFIFTNGLEKGLSHVMEVVRGAFQALS
jgi:acetylornithine deacetylase/succinyl-diaminopimelate desuccinylase-like protein